MGKWKRKEPDLIQKLAEVFREYGYEGTSLSLITSTTGLGKGSLYNAFPGGKEDMAQAVLENIDDWFNENVFDPLLSAENSVSVTLIQMLDTCQQYFQDGGRVCLMGVFATTNSRDKFHSILNMYFRRWLEAIETCLKRSEMEDPTEFSTEILSRLQGALILARSLDRTEIFVQEIDRLKIRIRSLVPAGQ